MRINTLVQTLTWKIRVNSRTLNTIRCSCLFFFRVNLWSERQPALCNMFKPKSWVQCWPKITGEDMKWKPVSIRSVVAACTLVVHYEHCRWCGWQLRVWKPPAVTVQFTHIQYIHTAVKKTWDTWLESIWHFSPYYVRPYRTCPVSLLNFKNENKF